MQCYCFCNISCEAQHTARRLTGARTSKHTAASDGSPEPAVDAALALATARIATLRAKAMFLHV